MITNPQLEGWLVGQDLWQPLGRYQDDLRTLIAYIEKLAYIRGLLHAKAACADIAETVDVRMSYTHASCAAEECVEAIQKLQDEYERENKG